MQKISYVIPCYRSELTLRGVVSEIQTTMEDMGQKEYQIILVNDSSPDGTGSVIDECCQEDARILGIHLARNFGQHAALMAGFHYVEGDVVVCLDDDGQTPACEVGKLLEQIKEYDVVYASYGNKKHSAFRNWGSRFNDRMTRAMLGKPKGLQVTSYFAARRFVVDQIMEYHNAYPYVIGLVLRTTKSIVNVPVVHRDRTAGESGYTLAKLIALWMNGFTAFSIKPLRMATLAGAFCSGAGFLYTIYTIIKNLIIPEAPMGYPTIISSLLFIGGVLMLMLGLIGEYVGRIYISLNNSPQYVVRRINAKSLE